MAERGEEAHADHDRQADRVGGLTQTNGSAGVSSATPAIGVQISVVFDESALASMRVVNA